MSGSLHFKRSIGISPYKGGVASQHGGIGLQKNWRIRGESKVGGKIFGKDGSEYTWAQPIDEKLFKGTNLQIVAPLDADNPVPSCRNADGPYNDKQFVLTVDGFIVSDNVTVTGSNVNDLGFKYSDHNPVYMTFKLNK